MPNSEQKKQIIQAHTYHPKIDDFYGDLFDAFKPEEIRPLQKLIWQVHKLEISLPDFLQKARDLKIKDFETKLWPQILRFDFLPVADALGLDLNEWVSQLPNDLQNTLTGKIITTEKWAGDQIISQDLKVSSEGRRRLIFLAGEYLRGEKNSDELKEQLLKPFKVGGLELEMEQANRFINDLTARFEEASANAEIFTSQKSGEMVNKTSVQNKPQPTTTSQKSAPIEKAAPSVTAVLSKPQSAPLTVPNSFTKDIKADIEEMQKSLTGGATLPRPNGWERQAEDIIKKSGVTVPPDLSQRFKTIIVSRLREVRKSGETKERLMAHTLNGGLGLSAEAAEKIMFLVEEAKKQANAPIEAEIKKTSEKIILEEPLEMPPPIVSTKEVVAPPPSLPVAEIKETPKPAVTPSISKISKPSITLSPKPVAKMPPSSSDIRPTASPVLKITEEKSKPKVQEVAMPITPKPVVTTVIPQTPAGRSKIEDVAYKPRLVGPVEELKEMDIVEFRRLSPKTRVAADKIISKVELLGKEGYERKMRGIEAWQKSSINQLYNSLLSESLNKVKPIAQVIAERLAAHQETLSEDEFKVIMELNRVLRF